MELVLDGEAAVVECGLFQPLTHGILPRRTRFVPGSWRPPALEKAVKGLRLPMVATARLAASYGRPCTSDWENASSLPKTFH